MDDIEQILEPQDIGTRLRAQIKILLTSPQFLLLETPDQQAEAIMEKLGEIAENEEMEIQNQINDSFKNNSEQA